MNKEEKNCRLFLVHLSNEWRTARDIKDKETMKYHRKLMKYMCKVHEISWKGPNSDYHWSPDYIVIINGKEVFDRDEKDAYKSK